MSKSRALHADLEKLESIGRLRTLAPRLLHDFSSNDYLGLAGSDTLRRCVLEAVERGVAVGSGGSRLLRGNTQEHEGLEEEAASFFGAQAALFVGSGYSANALLFSTLPQRGDLIVHDELVHASAREGIRTGRAEAAAFAHNDVGAAEQAIAAWRKRGGSGTPWLAFESLYSMDGDRAPLTDFVALADRTGAMLLIDEAHATGIFGPDGRGLASMLDGRDDVIALRTCGKALGCEGALILCPAVVRDFLINRGRSFIFSTAPSPLMAAVVRGALRILQSEPKRQQRLHMLVEHAATAFGGLGISSSGSPIQPIVIGNEEDTMRIAAAIQAQGFDVRGIRPPTVPVGTSRLRITLTLNTDTAAVSALAETLERLL